MNSHSQVLLEYRSTKASVQQLNSAVFLAIEFPGFDGCWNIQYQSGIHRLENGVRIFKDEIYKIKNGIGHDAWLLQHFKLATSEGHELTNEIIISATYTTKGVPRNIQAQQFAKLIAVLETIYHNAISNYVKKRPNSKATDSIKSSSAAVTWSPPTLTPLPIDKSASKYFNIIQGGFFCTFAYKEQVARIYSVNDLINKLPSKITSELRQMFALLQIETNKRFFVIMDTTQQTYHHWPWIIELAKSLDEAQEQLSAKIKIAHPKNPVARAGSNTRQSSALTNPKDTRKRKAAIADERVTTLNDLGNAIQPVSADPSAGESKTDPARKKRQTTAPADKSIDMPGQDNPIASLHNYMQHLEKSEFGVGAIFNNDLNFPAESSPKKLLNFANDTSWLSGHSLFSHPGDKDSIGSLKDDYEDFEFKPI